jgi:hypothetical protein
MYTELNVAVLGQCEVVKKKSTGGFDYKMGQIVIWTIIK